MAQASGPDVQQLFKKVYGQLNDNILPETQPIQKALPFEQKQRVGESYVEGVVLTNEVGITMSSSADLFELNPAVSGVVKQATVMPYVMVLGSSVPWAVASRSVGNETAFYQATRFSIKNNLVSHARFRENVYLYGQADALLGYVSYATTASYRGASFTDGTGTLTLPDGDTVTFTNGVNTANKQILFAPGQFASGLWVSFELVKIHQVDTTGAIVASGKLVSVNSELGFITVDFTPVPATSATSHRLCYDGMQSAQDSVGIQKILSSTGSLFGINTSQYSLWRGNQQNYYGTKFTLAKYNKAIANLYNVSALEGDLVTFLNPRSWGTITNDAADLRRLDSSYKKNDLEQGFEKDSLTFYSQNGTSTFKSHRSVKEGDAFTLFIPSWSISGSTQATFKVPGGPNNDDLIQVLPNQAGWSFRSFSDTYIFCNSPAFNIYHYNINDDAAN